MVRTLSLVSVLALLPVACTDNATTAELDAKAAKADAAIETATTPAEQPVETASVPVIEPASTMVGPKIGSAAPALSVVGADGNAVALSDLAGETGTILAFTRSAEWCPYCKAQMISLGEIADDLNAAGYGLATISYDPQSVLTAFKEKSELSYQLLSDPESTTITDYGLLNTEMDASTRYYGIPYPAIIFISADGNVQAILSEDDYKDRPSLDTVLATANQLHKEAMQ